MMNRAEAEAFIVYLATYVVELGDSYDPLEVLFEKKHQEHFVDVLSKPGTELNEEVVKVVKELTKN